MKKLMANLSDLVHAASEVAFACSENEHEAYHMTQQALIEFIKNMPQDTDFPEHPEVHLLSDRYIH
ncbi:MAG: hypothetical protein OEN50_15300, partial [Deltaproteobacteria bacterium]|nr:hypothetical protein [Deltaproteobacteria bacterium]